MFKKHVYTCPDVIHIRKLKKRAIYANLATTALIYLGIGVWYATAKEDDFDKVAEKL